MPISEIKVIVIRQSNPPWDDPADTIAISDTDGREIVIRRIQIPELIKKLKLDK